MQVSILAILQRTSRGSLLSSKAITSSSEHIFKTATYNTTGDYKTTFFVNGLRAIITTWLDNDCTDSVEQMNEIVMREYKKLFEE